MVFELHGEVGREEHEVRLTNLHPIFTVQITNHRAQCIHKLDAVQPRHLEVYNAQLNRLN